jgi:hypothetical protein
MEPIMATTSTTAAFMFGFLPLVSEKLTQGNYAMRNAQVSSTLKGHSSPASSSLR